ncbi:MAG: hypothetical protein ACM3MK_12545 [Chitinophagales bacterium]
MSGMAVAAHENEHVVREQAKASQEGKEVVSQSVQLFSATCPECGKTYVSGGRTTTRLRDVEPKENQQSNKKTGKIDCYA